MSKRNRSSFRNLLRNYRKPKGFRRPSKTGLREQKYKLRYHKRKSKSCPVSKPQAEKPKGA